MSDEAITEALEVNRSTVERVRTRCVEEGFEAALPSPSFSPAACVTSIHLIRSRWLVAGRMLRPLRTMNTAIKRVSAANIHQRLGLGGPCDELRYLADTVDGAAGGRRGGEVR